MNYSLATMKMYRWTHPFASALRPTRQSPLLATLLSILVALPALLASAGPAAAQGLPAPRGQSVDTIAAVVNNDVITRRELDARVSMIGHRLEQQSAAMPPADQLQRQVLEQMVLDRIQLQKAKEDGITVSDAEVQTMVQRLALANHMPLEQYQQRIEAQGVPWSLFIGDARDELTLNRLRQREVDSKITVSDAEVANYLASQPNAGAKVSANGEREITQTHARHILIRVGEGISEGDARRHILDIKQQIDKGADFATMARNYSADGSASQGGDLGWVSPGETVPDFERAMNALQPGQVSDPVRTEFGYHLIQVLERRQQHATLDQQQDAARQAIGSRKADQAFSDWLRELRDAAYIEYKVGLAAPDSTSATR